MARRPVDDPFPGIRRPGKVGMAALAIVGGVWVAFAIAINWAKAPPAVFELFCGNSERIWHGEVWRLLTAMLVHLPSGTISHVLTTLFGLIFLAPSLEQRWGSARFARFLVLSGVIAYLVQMLIAAVMPASISHRLVGEYWFGGLPVVEAIAVAWALTYSDQTVRLYFLIPITGRGLLLVIIAMSVMYVLAVEVHPEGLIAPFGGLFAGWLLGGSTPSPFRRLWLKVRLAQLDAEARRDSQRRKQRTQSSGLKVIEGGKKSGTGPDDPRGPDGRWLN